MTRNSYHIYFMMRCMELWWTLNVGLEGVLTYVVRLREVSSLTGIVAVLPDFIFIQ